MFILLLATSSILFADATEDFFNFLLEQEKKNEKRFDEKREAELLEKKRLQDKREEDRRNQRRHDDARWNREHGRII